MEGKVCGFQMYRNTWKNVQETGNGGCFEGEEELDVSGPKEGREALFLTFEF